MELIYNIIGLIGFIIVAISYLPQIDDFIIKRMINLKAADADFRLRIIGYILLSFYFYNIKNYTLLNSILPILILFLFNIFVDIFIM